MSTITAYWESAIDTPLVAPGDVPTIRIRRTDTQALVVTDDVMTEVGDGLFFYDFTNDEDLDYSIRADGDPSATGQVLTGSRYQTGSLGIDLQTVETWRHRGLDPDVPKLITEVAVGTDIDEDVGAGIHLDVTKAGNVTTIDRT